MALRIDLSALARAALEKALAGKPPLEKRKRMEALRDRLVAGGAEKKLLRPLRAVEVLERIGTPRARKILETLADGEPASPLSREARESLVRLERGSAKR